jgi:hypothetical protein
LLDNRDLSARYPPPTCLKPRKGLLDVQYATNTICHFSWSGQENEPSHPKNRLSNKSHHQSRRVPLDSVHLNHRSKN